MADSVKAHTPNNTDIPIKLDLGKLQVVVRSRFSSTSTETVLDKTKKLILNHVFDSELSENRLDDNPVQSQYTA